MCTAAELEDLRAANDAAMKVFEEQQAGRKELERVRTALWGWVLVEWECTGVGCPVGCVYPDCLLLAREHSKWLWLSSMILPLSDCLVLSVLLLLSGVTVSAAAQSLRQCLCFQSSCLLSAVR